MTEESWQKMHLNEQKAVCEARKAKFYPNILSLKEYMMSLVF